MPSAAPTRISLIQAASTDAPTSVPSARACSRACPPRVAARLTGELVGVGAQHEVEVQRVRHQQIKASRR